MGIQLQNKKTSLDLTYAGFGKFCVTIAYIVDKKFGEEFENYINDRPCSEKVLNDYMNRPEYSPFLYHLLFGDIEGKLTAQECKQVYNLIKNESACSNFGYVMYPVQWDDILDFFKECAEHRWICRWNG